MCRCAERDQGVCCWKGALCCISDRLTQPLPASDPLLTGSPVCQGRKKRKQRGSVHPGAEHRTLFILSPMLLPASPLPASGWLYFKIHKYSPLWGIEINWTLIPSLQWCLTTSCVSTALRLVGWNGLVLSVCTMSVCLAQPHLWHLFCYMRRETEEQGSQIKGQLWAEQNSWILHW